MAARATTEAAIAVIIPAHGQPGLLAEALAAVLGQRDAPPTLAIVIDDGCPFAETARTAAAFAAAAPGRVVALRRPQGGLSAARNTGIAFALAACPALGALYFLDADNRLHPPFLARAWAALQAAPATVGWVYPDFDRFGTGRPEASQPWSLLAALTANPCEAGSLVRRAVFETPHRLRFDETLRSGFEDWDFWLRAATAGFRGRYLPNAGFRYRRRPESMLAAAERQREALVQALHRRHAALFAPAHLLALEAAEAPRYALFETAAPAVRLLLDPAAEAATETLPAAAARERLLEALSPAAAAAPFPAILAFAEAAALAALRRARLVRGVFRQAELLLAGCQAVMVGVTGSGGDAAGLAMAEAPPEGAGAGLILVDRGLLAAAPAWLHGLAAPPPGVVRSLRVTVPGAADPPGDGALRRLALEASLLREARAGRTVIPAGWRATDLPPRETAARRAAAAIGLGPLLPAPAEPGQRRIGFLHPLFSLGGVERVALNQARVLRRHGWSTRLVVLGGAERVLLPALAREAAFDDIVLAPGRAAAEADWRNPYLGAEVAAFGQRPEADAALGLLAGLDVVVNTHSLGGHALMARLRALGTRTYAGLHLVERGAWGQPIGTPHTALAYEHAYDGALVISDGLRAWCAAQGWPAGKLHLIRNAPGYAAAPGAAAAACAARAARRAGPLHALFLGRLDAQKGVDRLALLIAGTAGVARWRVVGQAVLADAPAAPLGIDPEPPVSDPAALDALYAWADVVVLPSRFEGVPLTALEAQRMGCVVLATDGGEVAEILRDGEDGLLVAQRGRTEAEIVAALLAALHRLAADPAWLLGLGQRAAARAGPLDWETMMAPFLAHLDAVVPPRGSSPAARGRPATPPPGAATDGPGPNP